MLFSQQSNGRSLRFATEAKSPIGKAISRVINNRSILLVIASVMSVITIIVMALAIIKDDGLDRDTNSSMVKSAVIPLPRTIKTIDEHIYTEGDIPYFNESVKDYRERISGQLSNSYPNTIFISLASFRDNFCQDTLYSIFNKAKDPKRVFVGVVDQMKPWDEPLAVNETYDIPCENRIPINLYQQVRLVRVNARYGQGPTHARYIASKLWDGEAVFMQIDAHANFLQDWDQELLMNLADMPEPDRSVLSHYPASEIGDLGGNIRQWNCMVTTEWAPPGLLYQIPDWCRDENMAEGVALDKQGRKTTCYSPFIGAGFLAGPARILHDAPYDRYLPFLFHGEEILIGARLWTSGWDLFTPRLNLLTHLYGERRHNVYADNPEWERPARLSEARARLILTSTVEADEEIDQEIDRSEMDDLGMGSKRTLSDYLEYAGINWSTTPPTLESRCSMRYDGVKWRYVTTKEPGQAQE